MPTFEYKCNDCEVIYDVVHTIAEVGSVEVNCETCDTICHKVIMSAPNVDIPDNFRAVPRTEKGLICPLNIFEPKPDGSYRVTRIGKKKDLDND